MSKKALLLILDGWGIGDGSKSDAIASTPTPYWDSLLADYPHSQLRTDGLNVGLPAGQMGNSEVGHMNIGGGRVVYQDLVKINMACEDGSIAKNPEVVGAFENAKKGGSIHFMGLTSTGGVHSSLAHLLKLVDLAKAYGLEGRTFLHCFMDGRDTDPHSGIGFIQTVKVGCGEIASITGRFYAMDRDKRWDRIKRAYDQLTAGVGSQYADPVEGMQASYDNGVTDEFVEPCVLARDGKAVGTIQPGDTVIFFNYRNDRAKEITSVLTQEDMPEQGMKTIPLYYCCMTPYDAKFKGLHILFPKENVEMTLGEIVSNAGLKQLRIAETEKYAHVTFFFNGGREAEYAGEDRCLVPSPKVATAARDVRPHRERQARRCYQDAAVRLHCLQLRQWRYGRSYGSLSSHPEGCRDHQSLLPRRGRGCQGLRLRGAHHCRPWQLRLRHQSRRNSQHSALSQPRSLRIYQQEQGREDC